MSTTEEPRRYASQEREATANALSSETYEPLSDTEVSDKDFVATLLLCFFLGALGMHRFYVGKIGTGILMILTFGGFGIWYIIDFVMIAIGNFKDSEDRPIQHS